MLNSFNETVPLRDAAKLQAEFTTLFWGLTENTVRLAAMYRSQAITSISLCQIIKFRLAKGLPIDSNDIVEILAAALENNDALVIRTLMDNGEKFNKEFWDKVGKLFIVHNRYDLARIATRLITVDTRINEQDQAGQTPLMRTASEGDVDQVAKLIICGADVNIRDKKGNTVLHYAAKGLHKEVVELLLKNGVVNVGAVNNNGENALGTALKAGFKKHSENKMKGFSAAKPVISLLQDYFPSHSFGTDDQFFPNTSFSGVLKRELNNFFNNTTVTWILSAMLRVAALAVIYYLPFGFLLNLTCAAAIKFSENLVVTLKAYYDAKNPASTIISSGLQGIIDDSRKIDLEGKFLIGNVHVTSFGVVTGNDYKEMLGKHSAYKNAGRAYYTLDELPRNADGSLNLSGKQQLELRGSLINSYTRLTKEYDNAYIEGARVKLAAAIQEVKQAYGLVNLGINLDGLRAGFTNTFALNNVDYMAAEILGNRAYYNTFYEIYRRATSGAIKVSLEEMYCINKIHQVVQNPEMAGNSAIKPTVSAEEFFNKVLSYEEAGLNYHNLLHFADNVHAYCIENMHANKNAFERAGGALVNASNVVRNVVSGGVNAAVGVAANLANTSEQAVVGQIGNAVGTVAGVANGAVNYIARRHLNDTQVIAVAGVMGALCAAKTYPVQAYSALKMGTRTAINVVRSVGKSISRVCWNGSNIKEACNQNFIALHANREEFLVSSVATRAARAA